MSTCDANTRFELTKYMLIAVVVTTLAILCLSAIGVVIPEFVSGVVLMGLMLMLKDAYSSYFKAREEIQTAKLEVAKVEAAKII